jgi:hypothetical protein
MILHTPTCNHWGSMLSTYSTKDIDRICSIVGLKTGHSRLLSIVIVLKLGDKSLGVGRGGKGRDGDGGGGGERPYGAEATR